MITRMVRKVKVHPKKKVASDDVRPKSQFDYHMRPPRSGYIPRPSGAPVSGGGFDAEWNELKRDVAALHSEDPNRPATMADVYVIIGTLAKRSAQQISEQVILQTLGAFVAQSEEFTGFMSTQPSVAEVAEALSLEAQAILRERNVAPPKQSTGLDQLFGGTKWQA